MEKIYAKSPVPGGEGLLKHSYRVADRIIQLKSRIPALAVDLKIPNFWQILFWAGFFHDFGKIAVGFQKMLRTLNRPETQPVRHEIFSLAFVHWVFDSDTPEFERVTSAIASHHRDFKQTSDRYITDHSEDSGIQEYWQREILRENISLLAEWTLKFPEKIADKCGLDLGPVRPKKIDIERTYSNGPKKIREALSSYKSYYEKQNPSRIVKKDPAIKIELQNFRKEAICVRGILLQADRLASSNAPRLTSPDFENVKIGTKQRLYEHQKKSGEISGSAILSAPTGSGKTEAGLFWAHRQQREGRPGGLYYILPYQASLNAMYFRMRERYKISDQDISLLHSRTIPAIYRELVQETGPEEATRQAKRKKSLGKLHQQPFCIGTPYQLLRAAFRLPGYEGQWAMMQGAQMVVDEIHGYEPKRLGLLLGFFSDLRDRWDVRFFFMSATFPTWLAKEVEKTIGDSHRIQADSALFQEFRRHRLCVKDGTLKNEDLIEEIINRMNAGERILVVANLVSTAKELALRLKQAIPPRAGPSEQEKVLLLHGRFHSKDRLELESKLMKRMEDENTQEGFVVVATQVVEVSLDLDFDCLYTEPAPLEALLQRFGRVNRWLRFPEKPVYVMKEAVDWKKPYDKESLLRNTVELLCKLNDTLIDESAAGEYLDRLYSSEVDTILEEVEEGRELYRKIAGPETLKAFDSDPMAIQEFEQLFDGTEVLPESCLEEFERLLDEEKIVEAYSMLVPISKKRYYFLCQTGKIRERKGPDISIACCEYDSFSGLQ